MLAAACVRAFLRQMLGREVDLNRLVSQRMCANFLRSLGDVIKRFENSDLSGIVVSTE